MMMRKVKSMCNVSVQYEPFLVSTCQRRGGQQPHGSSLSLFSPLFDVELQSAASLGSSSAAAFASDGCLMRDAGEGLRGLTNSPMLQLLSACKPITALEVQISNLLHQFKASSSRRLHRLVDVEHLATELLALGYLVQVRDGSNNGISAEGRHQKPNVANMRLGHRFIVCTGYSIGHEMVFLTDPVIVEPQFREQFSLAHTTPGYSLMLQATPSSFVGTLDRLCCAVGILAKEMLCLFQQQSRPLPPWRGHYALLSKWSPAELADLARLLSYVSSTSAASSSTNSSTESLPGLHSKPTSPTTASGGPGLLGFTNEQKPKPSYRESDVEATKELQEILNCTAVSHPVKQDDKATEELPAWRYPPPRSESPSTQSRKSQPVVNVVQVSSRVSNVYDHRPSCPAGIATRGGQPQQPTSTTSSSSTTNTNSLSVEDLSSSTGGHMTASLSACQPVSRNLDLEPVSLEKGERPKSALAFALKSKAVSAMGAGLRFIKM